ncbi:alpha/beta hydrolase [Kitasatospora sp. NBC_01287]|uniref:alpha/beta fold hydrolase n=1 Tax=Kitasatospora sp. NBC_01287 TaxID=2903573 RepID=UPI0022536FEE|nr:alpha/beta hydrolase [Kitasatospora sp. NBC_01287]MCX4747268.1 alpha/beta hydrolase [Kitasatospora sp. NBC_01287]
MHEFDAPDGTRLAYHVFGEGEPLVCLPGGPMRDAEYLGDLGGLGAHRRLIVLDPRGTGSSAVPADEGSYRCDRQVADVEALRVHLGLDRLDLLAHSAAANLAVLFATRHPERVARLALVTPSTRAVGIPVTGETRREAALLREDEPWFAAAIAAFEAIEAEQETDEDWEAIVPFSYGRWDAVAQAHDAAAAEQENEEAEDGFGAEGAFDPDATRAALATLTSPVLVLAGELDWATTPGIAGEFAALLPGAELAVQQGAGHYPWLDDAEAFASAVAGFLDR